MTAAFNVPNILRSTLTQLRGQVCPLTPWGFDVLMAVPEAWSAKLKTNGFSGERLHMAAVLVATLAVLGDIVGFSGVVIHSPCHTWHRRSRSRLHLVVEVISLRKPHMSNRDPGSDGYVRYNMQTQQSLFQMWYHEGCTCIPFEVGSCDLIFSRHLRICHNKSRRGYIKRTSRTCWYEVAMLRCRGPSLDPRAY